MQSIQKKCSGSALAIELEMDPAIFFNSLFQLTAARIVVRGGDISVFRRIQFGVFLESCSNSDSRIHDPVSGLSVDTGMIRRICFLPEAASPASFELEFAGLGFSLAIFPEIDPLSEDFIKVLVARFGVGTVSLANLRGKGATDWLDEGFAAHGGHWTSDLAYDHRCGELEIGVHSRSLGISCRMKPILYDRDSDIVRLSDSGASTVVHFNSIPKVKGLPSARRDHEGFTSVLIRRP